MIEIPELRGVENYESVKIKDNGEKLINMEGYHPKIHVDPYHLNKGVTSALDTVYLREGVASRLVTVAEKLPSEVHLLLWDGWRSTTIQEGIYNDHMIKLLEQHPLLSLARLKLRASEDINLPTDNETQPLPHSTGGSVDLVLCSVDGNPLPLNDGSGKNLKDAETRYYEEIELKQPRILTIYLRRLLFSLMVSEGFTNNPKFWWHYDFGNQNWATIRGRDHAIYGYIADLKGNVV